MIIKPHKKKSRPVTQADVPRILEIRDKMKDLCYMQHGVHSGGYAIAHQQITKDDPLCFFVRNNGRVVINPRIVDHTKVLVNEHEGCLSFPDKLGRPIGRYNKVKVEWQTILEGTGQLSPFLTIQLKGREARIMQHEIDHFNCKYIYDN